MTAITALNRSMCMKKGEEGHEEHDCQHCGNNHYGYTCKGHDQRTFCEKNGTCMWKPIEYPNFDFDSINYKLFRCTRDGIRCFHFRRGVKSIMHAFSITFIPDGTVVLTGDYGVLAWKRESYPEHLDIFPNGDTHIGYFAEKVDRCFQIKEFSVERAVKELREHFEGDYEGNLQKRDIEDLLSEIGLLDLPAEVNRHQMLEILDRYEYDEWYEFEFGEDYTSTFKANFGLLKKAMEIIFEELKRQSSDENYFPENNPNPPAEAMS